MKNAIDRIISKQRRKLPLLMLLNMILIANTYSSQSIFVQQPSDESNKCMKGICHPFKKAFLKCALKKCPQKQDLATCAALCPNEAQKLSECHTKNCGI